MASQVYFVNEDGVGDFYECVSDASAGQSPATHPSKWAKIAIPYFLRDAIVEWAAGSLQQVDGQSDKRQVSKREGREAIYEIFIRHRRRGDYKSLPVHNATA